MDKNLYIWDRSPEYARRLGDYMRRHLAGYKVRVLSEPELTGENGLYLADEVFFPERESPDDDTMVLSYGGDMNEEKTICFSRYAKPVDMAEGVMKFVTCFERGTGEAEVKRNAGSVLCLDPLGEHPRKELAESHVRDCDLYMELLPFESLPVSGSRQTESLIYRAVNQVEDADTFAGFPKIDGCTVIPVPENYLDWRLLGYDEMRWILERAFELGFTSVYADSEVTMFMDVDTMAAFDRVLWISGGERDDIRKLQKRISQRKNREF